jgi:hypothetical protein
MVLDNDADARALGARAELDLGPLGQGRLGEGEGTVKPSEISLLRRSAVDSRRNRLLPQSPEGGYLPGLSTSRYR